MKITNLNENIHNNYNNEIKNDLNKNNDNLTKEINLTHSDNKISDSLNGISNVEKEINGKKVYIYDVKKYLEIERKNKDYINILKTNPEILFEIINEGTIMFWQSMLYNYESNDINSDADILTTEPRRKDQLIIKNDSVRTRFKETFLVPGFQKILEQFLTFYCNKKKIEYKQGLNEIFGPLILMQYKIKNLKLMNIFNIGDAFIDKFLPNYYYEKEFFSLKSSIGLFAILLRYHEPEIYNYFDNLGIAHELYTTNWMLTLMSQKMSLNILYNLWNHLIKINDPLFIHFILVALIRYKKNLIFECHPNYLLELLVNLFIYSKDELNAIIEIALELRKITPYSFRLLSNKIGFLNTNNKTIKENLDKYKPVLMSTMGILPSEIIFNNNKSLCPDSKCINYLKDKDKNKKLNSQHNNFKKSNKRKKIHICEKCDMKIDKNLNFIIIDIRLLNPYNFKKEDEYFKMGLLSKTMVIDKEELKSDNIDKLLSSHLLSIKGKRHIVLMTSKTYYFSNFEEQFYYNNTPKIMKKKNILGFIEEKNMEKKINLEKAEKSLDINELYKLKEYDILRNIVISMRENNFPYVSYLEGGFESLHEEAINHKLELVGHNKNLCKLCRNKNIKNEINVNKEYKKLNTEEAILNISDKLWENKKVITEKELNSLFSDENNIVFACTLSKYKNKIFHNRNCEFYVAILFDKKIIEIYNNYSKNEKLNDKYEQTNKDNINININNSKIKEENKFVLRLFDEIEFKNIEKVSFNHKYKNIIILQAKNKTNEKTKNKIDDIYEIELIFSTIEESKKFMKSIKKMNI